jgi:hypothetical protein
MLSLKQRAIALLMASLQVLWMDACPDKGLEQKGIYSGGTMLLVENGQRRLPREGTLELYVFTGTAWHLRVPVEHGEFCFELPVGAELYAVGRVILEGREATCDWMGRDWEDNLDLAVEARFHPGTRLRARLEGTELEFGHCRLNGMNSPGLVALPYDVPLWTEQEREWGWGGERGYEVTVPGCVPKHVRCKLSTGGDVWVDLVPLAWLSVDTRALGAPAGRSILVKGPRGFVAERPLAEEPREWTLDQLRPGFYHLLLVDELAIDEPERKVASFHLQGGESRMVRLEPTIVTRR